ncbi:hypothetical protein ACWED2_13390 [Amycolatopsis sp. NPDC005003]
MDVALLTALIGLTAGLLLAGIFGGKIKTSYSESGTLPPIARVVCVALAGVTGIGAFMLYQGYEAKKDEAAYRQLVMGSCERLPTFLNGPLPLDALNSRGDIVIKPFIAALENRKAGARSEFEELWRHAAPAGLADERDAAKRAAEVKLTEFDTAVSALRSWKRPTISLADLARIGKADPAVSTRLNDALTALAGQACTVTNQPPAASRP